MIPLWAAGSIATLWAIVGFIIGRRSAQRLAEVRFAGIEQMLSELRETLKPSTEASE